MHRAIFHVQRDLERLVVERQEVAVALCDRGTRDGLACWPGPVEAYWSETGARADEELGRYSAGIQLATPDGDAGYDRVNPLRVESADEARESIALSPWPGTGTLAGSGSRTRDFIEKALRALGIRLAGRRPARRIPSPSLSPSPVVAVVARSTSRESLATRGR